MSEGVAPEDIEIKLESEDLYREEVFTDRRVGTLRRLTPVTPAGGDDPKRSVLFVGQAQLWTQMGPLPISFEIDASTMEDALRQFPDAARQAVAQTIEEAKEMRREQASQIVVPGMGGPSKLQIP